MIEAKVKISKNSACINIQTIFKPINLKSAAKFLKSNKDKKDVNEIA